MNNINLTNKQRVKWSYGRKEQHTIEIMESFLDRRVAAAGGGVNSVSHQTCVDVEQYKSKNERTNIYGIWFQKQWALIVLDTLIEILVTFNLI